MSFPFRCGPFERVQVLDDQERMFIDGIAMVGVTNHQRVDTVKLGQYQIENSHRVHGAQLRCSLRAEENAREPLP